MKRRTYEEQTIKVQNKMIESSIIRRLLLQIPIEISKVDGQNFPEHYFLLVHSSKLKKNENQLKIIPYLIP